MTHFLCVSSMWPGPLSVPLPIPEAESTGHPPASLQSAWGCPLSRCPLLTRRPLLSTRLQITECETVFSVLMLLSSALFCNKSDLRHVDWVKSYLNIWSELQAYIKEHHTTGLTWSKTVSTSPSGDLSPGHQKGIETLVKTCIPCDLVIVSFRVYLKIGKELYGNSIFLRKL